MYDAGHPQAKSHHKAISSQRHLARPARVLFCGVLVLGECWVWEAPPAARTISNRQGLAVHY
jgi:hypothetical protein